MARRKPVMDEAEDAEGIGAGKPSRGSLADGDAGADGDGVEAADAAEAGGRRASGGLGKIPPSVYRLLARRALDIMIMMWGLGLMSAMVVARNGVGALGQWVVGIVVMLATFLSQTVFADEIGSIIDEAKAKAEEERRIQEEELAAGDFEGVPRIVQEMLPYPDDDEVRRAATERKRQGELIKEWGEFLRGEGEAPWKRERPGAGDGTEGGDGGK